jgi:hypothetical protein
VPQEVLELISGITFARSSNEGQLADAQTRVFRLLKTSPGEVFDIQQACGVSIGQQHPFNLNLYCVSFDCRAEGDSRMVAVCTFNYQSTPGAGGVGGGGGGGGGGSDPKSQPPTIRPANWSISSSLYEIPTWSWWKRTGQNAWADEAVPAANPAKDFYDGVSRFDALVTISVQQFEPLDPTRHARHVGAINSNAFTIGSLAAAPHTVMFRGLSSTAVVESWGNLLYRGWNCTYEFAYKANSTQIHFGENGEDGFRVVELGWDIAVPQTGFNVKAFAPPGDEMDELDGQPLKHVNGKIVATRALPTQVTPGDKVRGMVKVFDYQGGGAAQAPCAQPIPLNDNGRPRSATLAPLVYGYQVHRAIDFKQTLDLR